MAEHFSLPKLPRDIIKHIIEKVDDLKTLKNWALVDWGANAVAESILWRNVIIDIENIASEWFQPPEGSTDPLWTLQKEKLQQEDPQWFLDPDETEEPPLHHRNSLVKHISLRAKWDVSGEDPEEGILEETTLGMFQTSSSVFPNLKSIRIDGVVSQCLWDTLLKLPSLQELRLWRVCEPRDPLSNFQELSRLRALEIGMLSPKEALPLGNAVRESTVETLHISSTDVDMGETEESALAYFFAGLTGGSTDPEKRFENTEDVSCGFPSSLVELAIEDDCYTVTCSPDLITKAFCNCTNLTHLYLDLLDVDRFADLLRHLYLPTLAHLHMPLVEDTSVLDGRDDKAKTGLVAAFLERHQETLVVFHLLNAADDREEVKQLWYRLKTWLTIEEIRIDSKHTQDHFQEVGPGLEWTRTADFLGIDGRDHWGRGLCRARLDRFDLTNIHEGFMFDYTWQKLKVLVLNPQLTWDFGLLREPNDQLSPRVQESEWKHILGSARPTQQQECAEKTMADRIVRRMRSNNIRVISIGDFRFWVEPSNRVVWYLSDALKDEVQSLHITRHLNQTDWEFLSERASTVTDRGASTATFFRNRQLQSTPVDALAIDNDNEESNDGNVYMSSARDGFTARINRVLGGSVAEFSQLLVSQRRRTLHQLLVASTPIWIWDDGVQEDNDDSIEEDATLLLQGLWTGDDQISLEAQEVYYSENSFRLQLYCLAEFLHAYEPSGARDYVRRLIIMISATSDGWDDPEDLLQLLECRQIQQVILEIRGHHPSEVDLVISKSHHVIGQLQGRFGSGLKILKMWD